MTVLSLCYWISSKDQSIYSWPSGPVVSLKQCPWSHYLALSHKFAVINSLSDNVWFLAQDKSNQSDCGCVSFSVYEYVFFLTVINESRGWLDSLLGCGFTIVSVRTISLLLEVSRGYSFTTVSIWYIKAWSWHFKLDMLVNKRPYQCVCIHLIGKHGPI